MSPLNCTYDRHTEPDSWHLGVRGRKTGIQLPSIRELDQHDMEPLGAFFSSPDRALSAATGNGDPGFSQDDGNERAGTGCTREEMVNESGPLLFREPSAPIVHFAEPSPLQLQPILPAQMEPAVVCFSSTPEQHHVTDDGLGRSDTEPCTNAEGFSLVLSSNEDSEEDTTLPQTSRGIISPKRRARGRPDNNSPGHSKGSEGGSKSQERQSQTLSSISQEPSGDQCRPGEASCGREPERPRETATRTSNTSRSAHKKPALAQGSRPRGRPRGISKKGSRLGGKRMKQHKAKTVVRPQGSTYTTRSGRVCNTPIQDWRGDRVVKDYDSVPDITGRGQIFLPTITEVVRAPAEGASFTEGQRGGHRRKLTAKRSRLMTNTEREPWEELGTFSANCKVWQVDREADSSGAGESVYENQQVAFTSEEILNRFPAKPNFRFGRIDTATSMSFGMLHLPSGQTKEAKNTRGSQQVFLVYSGKVCVELEQKPFIINQGNTWVVPRGNQYSINNGNPEDAYIFFCLNSQT